MKQGHRFNHMPVGRMCYRSGIAYWQRRKAVQKFRCVSNSSIIDLHGYWRIIEAELPAAKNEATIWSGSAFPSMWKKQSGSRTGRGKGGNSR